MAKNRSEKIKVLYIAPTSTIGGAETFLKNTFLAFKDSKVSNHFLLFRQGELYDWLREHGANLSVLPKPPRLLNPLSWITYQKELIKVIKTHHIDLVHSTMAYSALLSGRGSRLAGKPHTWFQHGPASGWQDQLASLVYHQSVLFNSKHTQRTQKSLEVVPPKKRLEEIIPLGTPELFNEKNNKGSHQEWRDQQGIPKDHFVAGMLTRFQSWKGIHLVLQAMKALSTDAQEKMTLCLWGEAHSENPYVQELKQLSQDLCVKWMGTTKNKAAAYAHMDLLINASTTPEPFGLTLIEAMSAQTPILAPNAGGPAEMIQHMENGLLFQPGEPHSLKEQLQYLLSNRHLRGTLAASAYKYYLKHHSLNSMRKALEEHYEKLVFASY